MSSVACDRPFCSHWEAADEVPPGPLLEPPFLGSLHGEGESGGCL